MGRDTLHWSILLKDPSSLALNTAPLMCPYLQMLLSLLLSCLGAGSIPRLAAQGYGFLLTPGAGGSGHILAPEQREDAREVFPEISISLCWEPWG